MYLSLFDHMHLSFLGHMHLSWWRSLNGNVGPMANATQSRSPKMHFWSLAVCNHWWGRNIFKTQPSDTGYRVCLLNYLGWRLPRRLLAHHPKIDLLDLMVRSLSPAVHAQRPRDPGTSASWRRLVTRIFHAYKVECWCLSKGWGELWRIDWGSQGLHACSWLQDLRDRCLLRSVIWRTLVKSHLLAWPWIDFLEMNFLAKISLRQLPRVSTRLPIHPTCPSSILPTTSLHTGQAVFGTFEPDYLDTEGSSIPTYPPLNIQVWKNIQMIFKWHFICNQMKGYNFDQLEEYQSWVHRMAENMVIHHHI